MLFINMINEGNWTMMCHVLVNETFIASTSNLVILVISKQYSCWRKYYQNKYLKFLGLKWIFEFTQTEARSLRFIISFTNMMAYKVRTMANIDPKGLSLFEL